MGREIESHLGIHKVVVFKRKKLEFFAMNVIVTHVQDASQYF
jgi:hypothetical protein